jgi:membrane protease YdiL (CAAX protease family)
MDQGGGALRYLELGRLDRGRPWRYLLGVPAFMATGFLLFLPVYLLGGGGTPYDIGQDLLGHPGNVGFALKIGAGTLVQLAGLFLVVRFLHGRPVGSLFGPDCRIDWALLGKGLLVGLVVRAVATAPLLLFFDTPDGRLTHQPLRWLLGVAVGLMLLVPAAAMEELVFRGYISQGLARVIRRPAVVGLVSALLFALMHIPNGGIYTGVFTLAILMVAALFFSLLVWRANRIEAAVGVHASGNLLAFSGIFDESSSPLPGQPLYRFASGETDGDLWTLAIDLAVYAAVYWVMFRRSPARAVPAGEGRQAA